MTEQVRDVRSGAWFEGIVRDIRFAWRRIRREPLSSATAIVTLALAIGANSAILGVGEAVLFRSLPVAKPQELVLARWTSGTTPAVEYLTGEFRRDAATGQVTASSLSYGDFEQLRDRAAALTDVFASAGHGTVAVRLDGARELLDADLVSGGYYAGLGVRAVLGRALAESDDRPGGPLVAVISHAYWQRRFGGDPDVLARQGSIDGHPFAIVGVAPAGFSGTMQLGRAPDLWLPLAARDLFRPGEPHFSHPDWYWLQVMGRLAPGASMARAQDEVAVLLDRGDAGTPGERRHHLVPGRQGLTAARTAQRPPLLVLASVAGLILLMAGVSVGGLFFARVVARGREFATRIALGAGRGAIVRQVVLESTALAVLGGSLGVAVSRWTEGLLVAGLVPAGALRLDTGGSVLASIVVTSVAIGLLSGLPAGVRVATLRGFPSPARRKGAAAGLVVLQVALSVVLLANAALLVRSLQNLRHLDVGFSREAVHLFQVRPDPDGVTDPATVARRVLDALSAIPGVRAAGVSSHHLINDRSDRWLVSIDERPDRSGRDYAYVNRVGADYFAALGIPVGTGRPLGPEDMAGAAPVVVINQAFARAFFPDEAPLGKRVDGRRIVGVASDTVYGSLRDARRPILFVPFFQDAGGSLRFQVRGSRPGLATAVRQALEAAVPGALPHGFTTPNDQIREALGQERLLAGVTGIFGTLALLLTILGLHGSTRFHLGRRVREIGIRAALGATSGDLQRLLVARSVRLTLAGAGAGVAGALLLARALAGVLYGVGPVDAMNLAAAGIVVAGGALLACWLPARRALRLSPSDALRQD